MLQFLPLNRDCCTTGLVAIVAAAHIFLVPLSATSSEIKRFKGYSEPLETVERFLQQGNFPGLVSYFAEIGVPGNENLEKSMRAWLNEGQVTAVDLLKEETMGSTLKRVLYLVRNDRDDYLYLRIHLAKANAGWVLHNYGFNTDITKFVPDWNNP